MIEKKIGRADTTWGYVIFFIFTVVLTVVFMTVIVLVSEVKAKDAVVSTLH